MSATNRSLIPMAYSQLSVLQAQEQGLRAIKANKYNVISPMPHVFQHSAELITPVCQHMSVCKCCLSVPF